MAVRVRIASAYEELAFFALSCVRAPEGAGPAARAAQLFRGEHPALVSTAAPFEEDAAALGALAKVGLLEAQMLPLLFSLAGAPRADLAAELAAVDALLRRAAQRSFLELTALPETNLRVHGAIRGGAPLVELLLCDMALAAPAFSSSGGPWLGAISRGGHGALTEELEALAAIAPRLEVTNVVASAALGASGRGFGRADAPTVFCGLGGGAAQAREAALLVLHEVAVVAARAPYGPAERAAIEATARLVEGTPFAPAHARRTARLDLAHLPPPEDVLPLTDRLAGILRKEQLSPKI